MSPQTASFHCFGSASLSLAQVLVTATLLWSPLAASAMAAPRDGCSDPWPMCGAPGAGSCFAEHPGHGCDDKACCEAVCSVLPDCCFTAWDAACVAKAESLCAGGSEGCGGSPLVPNDCSFAALPLPVPTAFTVETFLANTEIDFVDCPGGRDVWFRIDPTSSGMILVEMIAEFDASLSVFDLGGAIQVDPTLLASFQIGCIEAPAGGSVLFTLPNANPCSHYLLRIAGALGDSGPAAGLATLLLNGPFLCGNTLGGACDTPHDWAGCGDASCCEAVCAIDPSCCDTAWDETCATQAVDTCGIVPACGNGGPCEEPSKAPSCHDDLCCGTVCAQDPWCCVVAWDEACVVGANASCGPCPDSCDTDLTCDTVVDAADLGVLLGSWGQPGIGDVTDDGVTDGADLAALLGGWGLCDAQQTPMCTATLTWVSWELVEGDIGTDSWNSSIHGSLNGVSGGSITFLSPLGANGNVVATVGSVVLVNEPLAEVTVPVGGKLAARVDGKAWEKDVQPAGPGGTALIERDCSSVGRAKASAICDGLGGSVTLTVDVTVKDTNPGPGENPHDGEALVRFTYLLQW
ncbi:MAG: hypothetical protein JNL80_08040 [Phycisphaerae bacterium]|jgi:hypothetical protein|nr:hypothetical protein [Phycisphaerae bacterium]